MIETDEAGGLSLAAIAAVARNRVIGDGAGLPWHLPEDFARFKRLTMGGSLIMGRRTYESLGGALHGRTSVVLTHDLGWRPTDTNGQPLQAPRSGGQPTDSPPPERLAALSSVNGLPARLPPPPCDASHLPPPPLSADPHGTVLVVNDAGLAVHRLATLPQPWWCIGGGQTYRALWPYLTGLDITEVKASPEGSVTFPAIEPAEWQETSREQHEDFDFVTYRRRSPKAASALREAIRHVT